MNIGFFMFSTHQYFHFVALGTWEQYTCISLNTWGRVRVDLLPPPDPAEVPSGSWRYLVKESGFTLHFLGLSDFSHLITFNSLSCDHSNSHNLKDTTCTSYHKSAAFTGASSKDGLPPCQSQENKIALRSPPTWNAHAGCWDWVLGPSVSPFGKSILFPEEQAVIPFTEICGHWFSTLAIP